MKYVIYCFINKDNQQDEAVIAYLEDSVAAMYAERSQGLYLKSEYETQLADSVKSFVDVVIEGVCVGKAMDNLIEEQIVSLYHKRTMHFKRWDLDFHSGFHDTEIQDDVLLDLLIAEFSTYSDDEPHVKYPENFKGIRDPLYDTGCPYIWRVRDKILYRGFTIAFFEDVTTSQMVTRIYTPRYDKLTLVSDVAFEDHTGLRIDIDNNFTMRFIIPVDVPVLRAAKFKTARTI